MLSEADDYDTTSITPTTSRTLTLNFNNKNITVTVSGQTATCNEAGILMTHKFDAFDNTRNKHYFEFVIPLDIIGNNLTTGSNFPGYTKYHVAAIRTYSIPHNEQQTETVPVPPVKYADQLFLAAQQKAHRLLLPRFTMSMR